MQRDRIAPPKIRHKDSRKDRSVVRMVTIPFVKELVKEFERSVGILGCEEFSNVTDEALLESRKGLVAFIRKGMRERKNLEVEIATQAMIVWWLRLEEEERQLLIEEAEKPT